MSKISLKQALATAAIFGAAANEHYMFSRSPRLQKSHYDEPRRNAQPVPVHIDRSEREFIIHGESIMAHDRKTALKIYANRHPETKKRKKK